MKSSSTKTSPFFAAIQETFKLASALLAISELDENDPKCERLKHTRKTQKPARVTSFYISKVDNSKQKGIYP